MRPEPFLLAAAGVVNAATEPPASLLKAGIRQQMVQGLVLVLGMVLGLVQGLDQVLHFFGVVMLHNNGRGGVIYHEFTTNRQNHLPPRFIVGMWLAGPVLAIRGMISSINLATLKVVEEERAVMGGCVGSERRVHMSSDSDKKK